MIEIFLHSVFFYSPRFFLWCCVEYYSFNIFKLSSEKMNVTQCYAIAAGGCIALLFIVNTLVRLSWLWKPCIALLRKHFQYSLLLRRHRFLKSWTHVQMTFELIYFAVNAFCICFKISTASDVITRAKHLSLINMMSTYLEFHLSFVCILFDVSLFTYRLFHASTRTMSIILDVLHAVISAVDKTSLSTKKSEQIFKIIVDCRVFNELISTDLRIKRFFSWSHCVCFRRTYFVEFRMSFSFAFIRV